MSNEQPYDPSISWRANMIASESAEMWRLLVHTAGSTSQLVFTTEARARELMDSYAAQGCTSNGVTIKSMDLIRIPAGAVYDSWDAE